MRFPPQYVPGTDDLRLGWLLCSKKFLIMKTFVHNSSKYSKLVQDITKRWLSSLQQVRFIFSVLQCNQVDFSCLDILKTGKRRSVRKQSLRSRVLLIKTDRCFEVFLRSENTSIVFRTWLKELFYILISGHKKCKGA